ncbi:MAG TPA: DUF523 and DUF1722 domain-containing protein [Candidatus Binatia bacterium]|nr:DUF523 and DUF1722 domain-containing protein [Candidatus Binatia bacterium]
MAGGTARGRLQVGVSACLLGQRVRWDGTHRRDRFVTDVLGRWVEWIPVCPEVEVGLGVPRTPVRLQGHPAAPRLVAHETGADHTEAMRRFARARVGALARRGLAGWVLKRGSPSCGMARVRVYGPGGAPTRDGTGLFARALAERLPLLPLEEESGLGNPARRESFVVRLLAHARWLDLVAGRPTGAALGRFHAAHELLLLAHDPAAWTRLGRIAARAGRRPRRAALEAYGAAFMGVLRTPATRRGHARALARVLRRLADKLTPAEHRRLAALITAYRRGRVPLDAPLAVARRHARRLGVARLAGQVYLDPHRGAPV